MSQISQTNYEYFPPPAKLSVWDKWIQQKIFKCPYHNSGYVTLKYRLIDEYYLGDDSLWTAYYRNLSEPNEKTSK